jgi:hypothetical protein
MVQSVREEHELIASFMKRNQERESGAERSGSAARQVALVARTAFRSDRPLPEPRPAAQKAAARLTPKTRGHEKVRTG